MKRIRASIVLTFVCLPATVIAQPPDPASDLKTLTPGTGLEINLFASDPAIAKPIQMNFDHRGRLWVVSSESYPQLKPGDRPRDKVFVLEDTDGDGRADKTSLFADGLLIPTGIEAGPAGVYVGQSTELVRIDKANAGGKLIGTRPVSILSGFGTEDTHHLIHSFKWSPDGWLFFGQSIYIHSHVETPWGVKRLEGGGFWMFRPESHRLEVFVHGMVNSWGIAWDEFGQAFGVDNHDGPRGSPIKWFLPGARFEFTPNESDVLGGIVYDKPKYCGAEFIQGEHFPAEFRGNFVTCDFRAHRVVRYRIDDDGSGFKAVELDPLVQSSNPNFRPVDVKIGPDGALYVCDWYNPIINHGEVDFRDPRRDKLHGRIWRISCKGRPADRQPDFDSLTIGALVQLQSSPNAWTRQFSRRAMVGRDPDAVSHAVDAWIQKNDDDRLALAGLWAAETVHRPLWMQLERRLRPETDSRVLAETIRMAGLHLRQRPELLPLIEPLARHAKPRVRLSAIRALAWTDDPAAMGMALPAYKLPTDRFLQYSLRLLARETFDRWIGMLREQLARPEHSPPREWIYPLLAVERPESAGIMLEFLRRGLVGPGDRAAVLNFIGRLGDAQQLAGVFAEFADAKGYAPSDRTALLDSLREANRLRGVIPAAELDGPIKEALRSEHPPLRASACLAVGQWKLERLAPEVAQLARQETASEAVRLAALNALGSLGGNTAANALWAVMDSEADGRARVRDAALAALAQVDAPKAAEWLVRRWCDDDKPLLPSTLEPLLRNRTAPKALAAALSGKSIPPDRAKEAIAAVNASGRLLPELLAALAKAGSIPAEQAGPSPENLARIVQRAESAGNSQRGREVYRREKLQCIKCHRVGAEGGEVGPALTTIGASAPVDYLVESLLWPDRKIKENYHSLIVETTAGEVFTGIPVRKSDAEIVLRNAEDKLISIPTRNVESSRVGGSIMPAGLIESLDESELADLVRYLSELGKPNASMGSVVARRWRLAGPFGADRQTEVDDAVRNPEVAARLSWNESWTTNDGWVYLREFGLKPQAPFVLAMVDLKVKSPGRFRLQLRPADAAVWLDGAPASVVGRTGADAIYEATLEPGARRLLIRIDVRSGASQLRLEAMPMDANASAEFVLPAVPGGVDAR